MTIKDGSPHPHGSRVGGNPYSSIIGEPAGAFPPWDQLSNQSRITHLKELGENRKNIHPIRDLNYIGFCTEQYDANDPRKRRRGRVVENFAIACKARDEDRVRELMDYSFYDMRFDQVFKIHLQPRPEYMLGVTRMVADLFEEDAEVRALSDCVKFSLHERAKQPGGAPEIVLYPASLGWESARQLLKRLQDFFKGKDFLGSGITPRGNLKTSNLIFLAQADGFIKECLEKMGLLGEYFDRESNYAFLIDEDINWLNTISEELGLKIH